MAVALIVGLGVGIGAGFGIWGTDEKTTPETATTAKPNWETEKTTPETTTTVKPNWETEKTTHETTTTAKPNVCPELETLFTHNELGTFKARESSVKSFKYK